jgi:hypothetical protein
VTTAQAALLVSVAAGLFALLGVVNSYRALRWQKRRDKERRRTVAHIEVEQSMSIGPYPGHPSTSITDEDVLPRKRRFWLAIAVINDSEEAAIFVRDVSVYGASTWEGTPLMSDQPDVRLEPRERLVKLLEVDDHDMTEFTEEGFIAQAKLSTGEVIDMRDKLVPDFVRFHIAARRSESEPPSIDP